MRLRSIAVDDGRQETDCVKNDGVVQLHNFCIGVEDGDSLEIFTASNESIPSRDEL